MTVLRIQNPAAFDLPGVREVIHLALQERPEPDREKWFQFLRSATEEPSLGVFMGFEVASMRAFGVIAVRLPLEVLGGNPVILCLGNRGSRGDLKSLIDAAWEFVRAAGYNRVEAMSIGSDDRLQAMGRLYGFPVKETGKVVEFQLDERSDERAGADKSFGK